LENSKESNAPSIAFVAGITMAVAGALMLVFAAVGYFQREHKKPSTVSDTSAIAASL
jgi:hypothetical protein